MTKLRLLKGKRGDKIVQDTLRKKGLEVATAGLLRSIGVLLSRNTQEVNNFIN